MTGPGNLIRLHKSQIKPAAEVLTRAFQDYPALRYRFPDETEMSKRAPYFFQYLLSYGVRYGEIYATSPNLEGIAIWLSSDNYPMTFWRVIRSVPLSILSSLNRGGESKRMKHFGAYIESMHMRHTPFKHWFLHAIGVEPQFQGNGYAGKLLRSMLARIDEEGLPSYTETMLEKNVQLYEHFGFRAAEKATIPGTNYNLWAMLRTKPNQ